jgi:hypothetical protein
MLQERGIRIVPWIRGAIEEVLSAHKNGIVETDSFLMPGCHRKGWCQKRKHDGKRKCRKLTLKAMETDTINERLLNENCSVRTGSKTGKPD